jgi:hypothetical protein
VGCSWAAVGIANVMVISLFERRPEIGLRRALGATRRHVGVQFLCGSPLLAGAGRGPRRGRRGGRGGVAGLYPVLRGRPPVTHGGAAYDVIL